MTDDTGRTTDATNRATTTRRGLLAGAAALGTAAVGGSALAGARRTTTAGTITQGFGVRIENVSDGETLATSLPGNRGAQPVPLSPGAYAVHGEDEPIFSHGEPERNNGLEEIAEDGSPGRLAASLAGRRAVTASGAFTTPVGADGPAPLTPGDAYEFDVQVDERRPHLSLVTMFVPSNDLFYTLGGPGGLRLFSGNRPVEGDVTDAVELWDAGTEVNQEPGVGDHQVQRQRAAGVGDVERGTVAPIAEVNGYDYPAVADVIRVTVTPQ